MAKDLSLDGTREDLIEGMYYLKMYKSNACWKGNAAVVDRNLAKLTSKTAKLEALKENIRMRVKGCGWEACHIAWSHQRRQRSVKELSKHLKWII